MPSRMIKIYNMEYYPLEGGKRRSAVMEPRYSVKLSLLVEEFGLKKVYPPPDFDNVRIVWGVSIQKFAFSSGVELRKIAQKCPTYKNYKKSSYF